MKARQPKYTTGFSLQAKYLLYSVLVSLVIVSAIFASYLVSSRSHDALADNIQQTAQIKQKTLQMRNHINALVNGVEMVMLDPGFKDQVRLIFEASFTEVNQLILQLSDAAMFNGFNMADELQNINLDLQELYTAASNLFEIRTEVSRQYPSMEVSNRVMRPARNTLYTNIDIALRELLDENPELRGSVYHEALRHAMQVWTSTIAEYRLYLANRVGSFDEEQLYEQEDNIDAYIDEMLRIAKNLLQFSDQFGLQAENVIPQMPDVIDQWRLGYETVKKIHHSDGWRTDSELMRTSVLPMIDNISKSLVNIDQEIEQVTNSQVTRLAAIGQRQNVLLFSIAAVFIAYSLLTFFILRKLVFRPITLLANELRSDDINLSNSELDVLKQSKETRTLIQAFRDMHAQVEKRQEELTYQAMHDALTDLPNRKALIQTLQHVMKMARRNKQPLCFLMLDLNGFKQVNDTLGHPIGDQLLIEVSRRLKKLMREVDTIARLGGDEFSIILPETDSKGAEHVAIKINQALVNPFKIGSETISVGTSIGIAEFPADGKDETELMKNADVAMYVCKRNKLVFHHYQQTPDSQLTSLAG